MEEKKVLKRSKKLVNATTSNEILLLLFSHLFFISYAVIKPKIFQSSERRVERGTVAGMGKIKCRIHTQRSSRESALQPS